MQGQGRATNIPALMVAPIPPCLHDLTPAKLSHDLAKRSKISALALACLLSRIAVQKNLQDPLEDWFVLLCQCN